MKDGGPDFKGERESFRRASETEERELPDGQRVILNVVPLSLAEQEAIHHNQIRYSHLQLERLGLPNDYLRTRYR